jgi:hypothetical protein
MGYIKRFDFKKLQAQGYNHFIETGTGMGWACDHMIRQGFKYISSVEQTPILYSRAVRKYSMRHKIFKDENVIFLYHGLSTDFLSKMTHFNKSIVFLDAHFAGGADFELMKFEDSAKDPNSYPLIDELKILSKKDMSTAVIIIDDARMFYKTLTNAGVCHLATQQWDKKELLEEQLIKFTDTHNFQLIALDQGYITLSPKEIPCEVTYSFG